ncbi:MAG: hypothetical protein M3O66_07500 [Verrucomicrobiota bacterium]|nr:hypothetical protein [Verrucomicrobiota bacterium]
MTIPCSGKLPHLDLTDLQDEIEFDLCGDYVEPFWKQDHGSQRRLNG